MTETVDPFCLGILSGISWVSGRDYYESINTACMDASAVCKVIRPNPLIVMVSVDCDEYAALLDARDFDTVQMYLADGVRRLVGAGANLLCIASNTGHICIPEVARRYPSLSIVHIADCTARAIVADNVAGGAEAAVDGPILVGLLGTEPTMRESYLKDRLRLHSIETIVPEADEDLAKIFNFIKHELGANEFKASTRAYFVEVIAKLVARGAKAIVLGCTEIELLELESHVADGTKLYRSALLHCDCVAQILSGSLTPEDLVPALELTTPE